MSSSYRLELNKFLSNLKVRAESVLDIGGSQLQVKGRTKTWDVKKYEIADLAQPQADSPKPDVILDLNELTLPDKTYDLIFCLEVFEYIYNPFYALLDIKARLKIGGEAWVTFPTIYPTHNPIEDDALRYMESGIRKLAKVCGLEIKDMIKRRPETDAIIRLWSAERMRAAKGYDHNFTGFIVRFKK